MCPAKKGKRLTPKKFKVASRMNPKERRITTCKSLQFEMERDEYCDFDQASSETKSSSAGKNCIT